VHVWVSAKTFEPVPVPDALRAYLAGKVGVILD
jgi:acyl-CoA thioesterase FadM